MKSQHLVFGIVILLFISLLASGMAVNSATTNSITIVNIPVLSPSSTNDGLSYILPVKRSKLKDINIDKLKSIRDKKKTIPEMVSTQSPLFPGFVSTQADLNNTNIQSPITYPDTTGQDVFYPPMLDNQSYIDLLSQLPRRNLDSNSLVENQWGTAPLQGSYHIPVFLVEFTDNLHDSNLTTAVFNDLYNSSNYLDGNGISVKEYLKHESYYNVDLERGINVTFDIYDWRVMPHTYAYYVTPSNTFSIIQDTLNLFSDVDYSQYDYDGDGRIDGTVIVHSGLDIDNTTDITARTYILSAYYNIQVQGLYVGNTVIVGERLPQLFCSFLVTGVGYPADCRNRIIVSAHEFMHVLGLPDLYEVSPTTFQQIGMGLGLITMMVEGTTDETLNDPINLDSWSRYFLGWLPAIDVTTSGTYNIPSVDTIPIIYKLRDPEEQLGSEFFLVENRYVSDTSQDKWLFGGPDLPINLHGGIMVYHIDEDYIENHYLNNTIMYDADNNVYDDTTHPGIVAEENTIDGFGVTTGHPSYSYNDFYTTEWIPWEYGFEVFDSTSHIFPPDLTFDLTSRAYSGVDTDVNVTALGPSGTSIQAHLQSIYVPPVFDVNITNPDNNFSYWYNTPLNFTEVHVNNQGPVDCEWEIAYNEDDPVIISNICNFTATPQSLGISLSGNYIVTLTAIDTLTNMVSTDSVNIYISSPYAPIDPQYQNK